VAPDVVIGVHRTDTIDYDTVLRGEIVLVLDDEEVVLQPNDCVMLPGVVHGWRCGPDGATISVVQFGIDPVRPNSG
jgi:quercetin dioxygenase-like cupin family protein